ncbi:MAG: TRAP transporter TatT component family protein [Desulfobacca sp.]|uniref:TRAP transporter TatT component family protein n=1 Tax=Desulfobacca sp. TaxID=2067990 RepID=UPI0040490053
MPDWPRFFWRRSFLLSVLLIFLAGAALAAATLEQADRLLLDPQVDRDKALQALSMYESLLPAAGTERLLVLARLARAAFFLGDLTDGGQRRLYYEQGRQYAETMVQEFPASVAGHYWLGLNLAGLADVSRLQALRLLPKIMAALERAAAIDPAYDQAGAYRVLGRIYFEAPGRPLSVGDINKSLVLLQKASQLAPANSTNYLYLGEALLKAGRPDDARRQFEKVLTAAQNADGPRGLEADRRQAQEILARWEQ